MTKSRTDYVSNNEVMDRIKSGEIKIRPRYYYILLGILSMVVVLLLASVSAYLISIVSLWARIIVSYGPAYRAKLKLSSLFETFPWPALLFGLVTIGILIYIVRKIGHLYKVRLIYVISLIVIVLVSLGTLIAYSGMVNNKDHGVGSNYRCLNDDINCEIRSHINNWDSF